MASSKPINFSISDVIQWFRRKELVVNETFQRYSVWTTTARTYLIDTILHELPMPKIYFRTLINPTTQTSIREIVDGQQRVRALYAFANNDLRLTQRSDDFAGKKYEDLTEDQQEQFLGYIITAEQLLNASDDDVIDIFARLNSYTVALNPPEKRHAEFQTEFKFAVRSAAQEFRGFIEKHGIFGTKQRFRMLDDSFFAEVYGVFLEGVKDGGERNIYKLYKRQDDDAFTPELHKRIRRRIDTTMSWLDSEIGTALTGHFSKHYTLLMLIAAYAHTKFGIPRGDLDSLPERQALAGKEVLLDRISKLERGLESDPPPARLKAYVQASESSTHRIASRRVRFQELCRLLSV